MRLPELHAQIDQRVNAIRAARADWPCSKGCDTCCRRLAEIPTLTEAEWLCLREGLAALPAPQQHSIRQRAAEMAQQTARPLVCPMLDQSSGACPVYAQRPVACRSYGFYVQRDAGLYCREIETRVAQGDMADVVWGNHDAIDHSLRTLGQSHELTHWLANWA